MVKTIFVALAALSIAAISTAADAKDQRVRRTCRAAGAQDISMSVKYEVRGAGSAARRVFSTEFEAAPNGAFAEGARIVIQVDGTNVGAVRLDEVVGGDLVGDVNFDTRPQLDADPFPGNWPASVGRGTVVNVLRGGKTVLGCALR